MEKVMEVMEVMEKVTNSAIPGALDKKIFTHRAVKTYANLIKCCLWP